MMRLDEPCSTPLIYDKEVYVYLLIFIQVYRLVIKDMNHA